MVFNNALLHSTALLCCLLFYGCTPAKERVSFVIKVTGSSPICDIVDSPKDYQISDAFERSPIIIKNEYESVLTVKEPTTFKDEFVLDTKDWDCYWNTTPVNVAKSDSYTVSMGKWSAIARNKDVISVDAKTLRAIAFN